MRFHIQGVESNLQLVSLPVDEERIFEDTEQGRESTPKYSEAELVMQEESEKNEDFAILALAPAFSSACLWQRL